MGLLEDALRDTFSNRVAAPPAVDDLAGQAIRRAGAIRRRQVTVASVAVVVTVVLVGVGMLSGSPLSIQFGAGLAGPTPSPTPTTAPANPLVGVKLPVDVLNGDRIQVSDGRVISLAGLGTPQKALRVSPGWLVQTNNNLPDKSAVWLVDEKGFASQLAAGETTMVSAGTQNQPAPQIAWTAAGRLSVASFVGRALTGTASTTGADKLLPQLAVAGGLLLAGSQGGADVWDMWYPDKGAYKSTPTSGPVSAVLGVTADGKQLYALQGKPSCLGLADPPPQFTMFRTNCVLTVGSDDRLYASPSGRWLLVLTASGYAVYDTSTVWTSPQWASRGQYDLGSAATGSWLDDSTFAIYAKGMVVRATATGGAPTNIQVPDPNANGAKAVIEDVR